ncbi:hypothetical protein ACVWW1_004633 [Bradyrhizobium sp. JR3.5]
MYASAYKIMPRDTLQATALRMSVKPVRKLALHWQAVDGLAERIRRHLRPLYVALDPAGTEDRVVGRQEPDLSAVPSDTLVFARLKFPSA